MYLYGLPVAGRQPRWPCFAGAGRSVRLSAEDQGWGCTGEVTRVTQVEHDAGQVSGMQASDGQTQTAKHAHKQLTNQRDSYKHTDRQLNEYTDRQLNKHTDRQLSKKTDTKLNKQTNKQTTTCANTQTDKQTSKQTSK